MTEDNIRTLRPVETKPEINRDALAVAEKIVARIKAGEISGFVAISDCADGRPMIHRAGVANSMKIVGTLEWLKWEMLKNSSDEGDVIR